MFKRNFGWFLNWVISGITIIIKATYDIVGHLIPDDRVIRLTVAE